MSQLFCIVADQVDILENILSRLNVAWNSTSGCWAPPCLLLCRKSDLTQYSSIAGNKAQKGRGGSRKSKIEVSTRNFLFLWIFNICHCLLLLQCNRTLLSLLLLLLSDTSPDRKKSNKILPPMEAICSSSKAERIAFVPPVTSSQKGAIKYDLKVVMSIRE